MLNLHPRPPQPPRFALPPSPHPQQKAPRGAAGKELHGPGRRQMARRGGARVCKPRRAAQRQGAHRWLCAIGWTPSARRERESPAAQGPRPGAREPSCPLPARSPPVLVFRRASMEAEPTEAAASLPPAVSWQAAAVEEEEEEAAPSSTSPTAREVEEELIPPASTSLGSDEDTVLPRSSSLEGEDELPDPSLPSSSEWPEPQSASPSEPSAAPLESSPFTFASLSPSSLSWKAPSDGPQRRLEEAEGRGEQGERPKAKKKGLPAKKGAPSYTVRTIVPAEKEELVSVAKAMHREKFAKSTKELFHLEKEAALKSLQTGLYIGWRCPEYLWDCFRVGDESKCFCGHLLKLHQVYVEKRATVPCTVADCRCQGFLFVPSCPEEVGEFWLRRRTGFDVAAWRAKCRCTHTHEEHTPIGARGCCVRGCSCMAFTSSFLCAACDRRWEEHETFFESEETRRRGGRPYGPRRFLQKDDKKA
ncbi:protein FAM221B isoform X3 [Pantherophis guttatus]|uniref:Protein FAM221B isoform X3 n=1 Tax=Pantherophis guttatus TaxID=94885 RepID=A0A6P9DP84_PANGU|nr:protein FAM221B isoform X3 [Pantherophis guttatus]